VDSLQHQLLHEEVSVRQRMAAVFAEGAGQGAVLVGKGGVKVHVGDGVSLSVGFQVLVDPYDGLRGILDLGPPPERSAGWDGSDDGHNAVGTGNVAHGHHIVYHPVGLHPIGVVGHIVGAGHDDHRLGMQLDHVVGEPHQHLRRGLTADATPTKVVLAEKAGMIVSPVLSDGIAHEDHFGEDTALNDAGIVGMVTLEAEPIL